MIKKQLSSKIDTKPNQNRDSDTFNCGELLKWNLSGKRREASRLYE